HCNAPPLPSRLASRSSIRRTRSGMTRSAWERSQQRPSLIGFASLPKPTIAPLQIEQTLTGFMVMGRASLVAAALPPDLLDRAKHLLDSANVAEPQGSPGGPPGRHRIRLPRGLILSFGRPWKAPQYPWERRWRVGPG